MAESGDRRAIDGFNQAMRELRGEDSAHGVSAFRMLQDAMRTADQIDPLQERVQSAQAFEDMMKKYHRKNPSEVVL